MTFLKRVWPAVATAGLFLTIGGCGPKDFQVSGLVTFDGKPIPRGFIYFEPDADKGNSGRGGGAEIRDGKFTTPRGKGVLGGPYRVKIVGYDGVPTSANGEQLEEGKPLFPAYTTTTEFPNESTSKDFEVPLKPTPTQVPKKPGVGSDGL